MQGASGLRPERAQTHPLEGSQLRGEGDTRQTPSEEGVAGSLAREALESVPPADSLKVPGPADALVPLGGPLLEGVIAPEATRLRRVGSGVRKPHGAVGQELRLPGGGEGAGLIRGEGEAQVPLNKLGGASGDARDGLDGASRGGMPGPHEQVIHVD